MQVRFAEAGHVTGILNLLRQVGKVHHGLRPDLFRESAQKYGASQVLSMLSDRSKPIFVAVEDDRVLGYCFCQVKDFSLDPVMASRKELYIDDLCVDETCRGQGIGKTLFEEVCRYGQERKCGSLALNVWACNEAAVKFYEKMGLKVQEIGMEASLEKL